MPLNSVNALLRALYDGDEGSALSEDGWEHLFIIGSPNTNVLLGKPREMHSPHTGTRAEGVSLAQARAAEDFLPL